MHNLKPIKLAGIDFKSPIIQGPLAGYSCAAFRKLIWQNSQPAFCYTEMLPAKQICLEQGIANKFTYKDPSEGPLCFQLSGNNPNDLATATAIAISLGADCIDLNAGCPKPKIRKKQHGSALLENPELIYNCLSAMRKITNKPLLLKIRIKNNDPDFNQAILNAANSANVDAIVIHARNWLQDYNEPCDWHQIKPLISTAPLILNGDLDNIHNIKQALTITNCNHIMVSRASMGQPDLINHLLNNCKINNNYLKSSNWLRQHLLDLEQLTNSHTAALQARSIVKYYAKKLPTSTQQAKLINAVFANNSVTDIIAAL